jgi:cation transport ATPase
MQKDFLYVVASLAPHSSEPFASDITRIADINAIKPVQVEGFQEYLGRGMGGLVQIPGEARPRAVLMGSRQFLEESGLEIPAILEATAQKWEAEKGGKILLAGWDAWVRGVLKFKKS